MKKFTLLLFTLFALCSVNLNAEILNLPLNPAEPAGRTIGDVFTDFNNKLEPRYRFSLHQFKEAPLSVLPGHLSAKLQEHKERLSPQDITQTLADITALEICANCTVLADPTPTLRRTKPRPLVDTKKTVAEKPCSLIPILLRREQAEEDRLSRKFSSTVEKKISLRECTLMPQSGVCEDELGQIINPSVALSYKNLTLWADKKCGIRINPAAYPTLAALLKVITVNLKIFLDNHAGKSDPKTLLTAEQLYTFLSEPEKPLSMGELEAVQAAVDDILAFVKLLEDPESPTGVTAV